MLTPATRASSTSNPWVIRVNAFWTPVISPPFLNTLPFAEEMTTGLTPPPFGAITAGAGAAGDSPKSVRGAAAARPAAAAVAPTTRKSRRLSWSVMDGSPLVAER